MSNAEAGGNSGASSGIPPVIGKPAKISQGAFQVAIGVLLGIALITAGGRILARLFKFQRVLTDDMFFFLASVTLIAGTVMTYIDIPLIYLQMNVQAGLQVPPPDIIQQLLRSVKLQSGAAFLLATTVFAVKFSFLFFFRAIIGHQKRLMYLWWTVFIVLIPTALLFACTIFISCPYFDERILVKCVGPAALSRQNGVFKASAIVDILTDALLISIPVFLLWHVQIDLHQKVALGGILCLSIFMIIIAIIRIAAGNVSHGQVDAAWAIFWLQVEASVAVMVVSVSAFRALFVARQQASKSRDTGHQIQTEAHSLKASTSTWKNRAHWSRTKSSEGHSADSIELPATQSTTSQAVTTRIQPTLYDDRILDGDRESTSRLQQGAGIWVTKDLSSDEQNVYLGAKSKPSVESFV